MGFHYKKNIGKGFQMKRTDSVFKMIEDNAANPLSKKEKIEIDKIVNFDNTEMQQGSPGGMFIIPLGIYNRYKDAKEKFKNRQIEQNQIKFGDFKENIQNYKNDPNFSVFKK